jgi:hypothetical protein
MAFQDKMSEQGIRDAMAAEFDLTDVHVEHNRRGRVVIAARHQHRGPGTYASIYSWLHDHGSVGVEWFVQLLPVEDAP